MRTEGTTTATHRFVNLNVGDHKVVRVNALKFRVGLAVLEETEKELSRLFRPATDRHLPGIALRLALHTDLVAAERHNLLLLDNVLKELLRTLKGHPLDRCARFMGVLEMNTQVASFRLHGCGTKSDAC